tara:strand:+ start:558 stop:794 length:237 start_codon:yes stop_codon:yes gene_type:complete
MDRNISYYKEMNLQMDLNKQHNKEGLLAKKERLIRSPSKEQLIINNLGDIFFDIKQNIPEGDYIQVMNYLKQLNSIRK